MTPYKFLIDYRLQRSQSLLENKNLTVTEISQQIGFSDTSHFIQSFKKNMDERPDP
ncbi:helix-turn-helix domain-containing protein [Enterococcus casseliflavus]|nr:helix-turn-helix domain-containing protein [Enterococcus casseliflavus]